MKKIVSVLALLGLSVLLAACSHPIKIIGQGDVTSASGNRRCLLENYQQGLSNCKKNYVTGAGDYNETYYGVARPGWRFHRWANYCLDATNNECEFHVPTNTVKSYWGKTVPPLVAIYRPWVNTGFDSLFMGHSRFIPVAAGYALPRRVQLVRPGSRITNRPRFWRRVSGVHPSGCGMT